MNNRTPLLAIVLGGVVGLYVLVTVVRTLYLEPRKHLAADIATEQARRNTLLLEQAGLASIRKSWQRQTAHTLSEDPNRAQPHFRDDIVALAKKHGLVGEYSIGPRNEIEVNKGPQKGFVKLPIGFSCSGTLKNLEGFLLDLYELPYYVAVDKLTLTPSAADQGLTGSKKKEPHAAPDGPEIKINMDLATLVLPTLQEVKSTTQLQLAALASGPAPGATTPGATTPGATTPGATTPGAASTAAAPPGRGTVVSRPGGEPARSGRLYLKEEDAAAYALITRANLFKPYVEQRIVVNDTPRRPPTEDKPTPPPPPPPPPDSRVVLGTTGMGGNPVAFVRKESDKLNPPEELHLNEAVSDDGRGRLVLIHPKGIVVRVANKDASQPPKNYFVALGAKMADRVELTGETELEFPDVCHQLTRVLTQ